MDGKFKKIKGITGKLFVPSENKNKKHNCEDCSFCQWCSDSRCRECLSKKNKKKCSNSSIQ